LKKYLLIFSASSDTIIRKENEYIMEEKKGSIGDRLKFLIETLNLSKGEFAKNADVSQSLISNILSGNNGPSRATINLICNTYGINKTWLRDGTGEMLKKDGKVILDDNGKPLNYEEGKFINTYRRLTDPNKEVARTTVDALLKSQGGAKEKLEKEKPAGIGQGNDGETG
jgi:transcriptional regulator with XRE-family HTH domain